MIALIVALGTGCSISPQPHPPDEVTTPSIQIQLLVAEPAPAGQVTFAGNPGAVTPPLGVVRALGVSTASAPLDAPVASDGSFRITLPGVSGDIFRLQARSNALYSKPVDVAAPQLGVTGPVSPAPVPLAECLFLDPPDELVFEPTEIGDMVLEPIVIRNGCTLTAVSLVPELVGSAGAFGVFLNPAQPEPRLTQGSQLAVGISFQPLGPATYEDVLRFTVRVEPPSEPPVSAFRWLTIRGDGTSPEPPPSP